MIPAWVGKYIGIRFKMHGRDARGADCWGLVRLVLAEQRGIELPCLGTGYDSTSARNAAQMAGVIANEAARSWQAVPKGAEQVFDVIQMDMAGHPMHVGVVLGGGRMLHVMEGRQAVAELYDTVALRNSITGFWRHVTQGPDL